MRSWCVAGTQVATAPCNCIIRHAHQASDNTCQLACNTHITCTPHVLPYCHVAMSPCRPRRLSFAPSARLPYPSSASNGIHRAQTTAGLAFLSRRVPHLFLSACPTLHTPLASSRLVTTTTQSLLPAHPSNSPATQGIHPPITPHLHARSPTVVCPSRTSRPSVSLCPRGACEVAADKIFRPVRGSG
jgi:hypothetical protein